MPKKFSDKKGKGEEKIEMSEIKRLIEDGKSLVQRFVEVDGLLDSAAPEAREAYEQVEKTKGRWEAAVIRYKLVAPTGNPEEWAKFRIELRNQEARVTPTFVQLQEKFRQRILGAMPYIPQKRCDPQLEAWLLAGSTIKATEA